MYVLKVNMTTCRLFLKQLRDSLLVGPSDYFRIGYIAKMNILILHPAYQFEWFRLFPCTVLWSKNQAAF